MPDYSKWKRTTLRLSELLLDPGNWRLNEGEIEPSQAAILAELVLHEDLIEIIESIAASDYLPNEAPLVTKNNGKYTVVEGNRRVGACMLLIDPSRYDGPESGRIRRAAAEANTTALKELEVFVVPSREAALPYVAKRHNRRSVRPWATINKARFAAELIEGGATIEEAAAKVELRVGELLTGLRYHNAYKLACHLELPPAIAEVVRDPRQFKVTDLERAYETREIRHLLGFNFDTAGEIVGEIQPEEFLKGYKKLVTEIVEKRIGSRATKNKDALIKRVRSWPATDRPDLSKKGSFTGTSIIKAVAPQRRPLMRPKPAAKKRKRKQAGVVPGDFVLNTNYPKIEDVFSELRLADPETQALTCCVLIRTLAEMGLYELLEKKGRAVEVKPKSDEPPSLSTTLGFLLNHKEILDDRHLQKALTGLRDQKSADLNLLVHNLTFHADKTKARTLWKDFEKLLRKAFA